MDTLRHTRQSRQVSIAFLNVKTDTLVHFNQLRSFAHDAVACLTRICSTYLPQHIESNFLASCRAYLHLAC